MDARRDALPTHRAVVGIGLVLILGLAVACVLMFVKQGRTSQEVSELRRAVNLLARLPANSQDAQASVDLGSEAIRRGRWDLGQLYFVNAVTNAPRHVGHLDAFATAVLGKGDAPLDALERLSSVLQLAAYQVDSGDVPAVLALIERVEQARKRTLERDADGKGPKKEVDLPGQLERLAKVDPDIWKKPHQLAAQLKALEGFVTDLDELEPPQPELAAKAAAEFVRWSEIAQAAKQCAFIDGCLERIGKGEDLSTQRAVAVVQAAENALPTFWGLSPSVLPADLRAKVDGYPCRIQSLVEEIGRSRSASVLKQIHAGLAGDANKGPGKKWQDKCKEIEEQLKKAQELAMQLSSTAAMSEAQKCIKERSDELRRCRNNQYYEYQKKVIEMCDGAFKECQRSIFNSEKNARDIFSRHFLARIDQSLLSPEVSRIFNDVLGKLTGQMGPGALVNTEREMGTSAKMKLEDF